MKTRLAVRSFVFGAAGMVLVLAGTAMAAEHKTAAADKDVVPSDTRTSNTTERVVLVPVTGSWIPQRVVVMGGRQVNSASPLVVFQGSELSRSGSATVAGILAQDPSITFSRHR